MGLTQMAMLTMEKKITGIKNGESRIALIGLGYVGLPLALEFGKKFDTAGFDVKKSRLESLRKGEDTTGETGKEDFLAAKFLTFTDDPSLLRDRDFYIVSVPTPVDKFKRPDLTPLLSASRVVGQNLAKGAVVIYESTVYPGCTEEDCVPVLEKESGLVCNRDFFVGYSPERINPGDPTRRLTDILKVTSGSTEEAAEAVDALYSSILHKGTYKASSIKVAEAAKVIENSQRDLNIAFVNELSKIFHLMGIDTQEVLKAAGTKWNFLPFRPGLVGGHCIGVDPYYLTHKAQSLGYLPEVILAGRRINDGMGKYVATEMVKLLIKKEHKVAGAKVLQLGVTFKENCPDTRNSLAVDLKNSLEEFGCCVELFDPLADREELHREYGINACISRKEDLQEGAYDALILAVSHKEFENMDVRKYIKPNGIIYDIKGVLDPAVVDGRL